MTENEEHEILKQTLDYDPLTGVFTSLLNKGRRKVGDIMGNKTAVGYMRIWFNGRSISCHQLAWFYMTGKWSTLFIDHKDTDRANNKWSNLREVSKTTNTRNKSKHKNNTSGVVGVSWNKTRLKWQAHICVEGRMINLGNFEYMEDAIFARMTAEKKYGYWLDKVWDQL